MRQVYHFPQQAGKRRDFDFEQKDFLNHGNWKYAILSAVEQQYLNIAIVPNIAGASGRDHLSGVLKYINTGKRWSPRILNTPDDLMRACAGRNPPDGIVTITPPGALNENNNSFRRRYGPDKGTDAHEDLWPNGAGEGFCNRDSSSRKDTVERAD